MVIFAFVWGVLHFQVFQVGRILLSLAVAILDMRVGTPQGVNHHKFHQSALLGSKPTGGVLVQFTLLFFCGYAI